MNFTSANDFITSLRFFFKTLLIKIIIIYVCIDFELFRSKYGELMKTDDLYLGYYLHLVQDICYRHFVYDKYKWNPMIPGNVEKLHKDYSIIKIYVATR